MRARSGSYAETNNHLTPSLSPEGGEGDNSKARAAHLLRACGEKAGDEVMLRAGRLRHLITIEALNDGQENPLPSGALDQYWEAVAALTSIHASVTPLAGRELFAAQEYHSEVTHSVRIRAGSAARSAITAKNRILFGTRYFTIHWVRNIEERGIEIEMLCSEGLADQQA